MTKELEQEAKNYIAKIDDMGGMVKAIEMGFPQREIADSAYLYQKAVDNKDKIVVGLNDFTMDHEQISLLEIDDEVAKYQIERLKNLKNSRNYTRVKDHLAALKKAAADELNLMPFILDCVKSYATLGEIMDSMKDVFGEYQEPILF
jgi:methylmalonyl-CoA mutase N-terminal domain/subunit